MPKDFDLLEGSPLLLNCSLTVSQFKVSNQTYEVNGSHLVFKFKNNQIPQDQVVTGPMSIVYRKERTTLDDAGMYYCNIRYPDRTFHVCATTVSIGDVPPPVEDFRCISYQLKMLNCSWKNPHTTVKTDYTLGERFAFSSTRPGFYRKCPIVAPNKTACAWTLSSLPPLRKEAETFRFVIAGNNSLGVRNWTYDMDHFEILKVSAPRHFVCSAGTKRSLTINWEAPVETDEARNLSITYQIHYESEYESRGKVVEVQKLSTMIQKLHPFTEYTLALRAKSSSAAMSDLWSDEVSLKHKTLPDVPEMPPRISPSGFLVQNFKTKRSILLNFEAVHRKYWGGATLNYIIQCCNDSTPRSCINKTSEIPMVTFDGLLHNVGYNFQIWSQNENGISKEHSSVRVDRFDNTLGVPEGIEVTAMSSKKYYVSWKMPSGYEDEDLTYTVFWCPRMLPRSYACNQSLHWVTTNSTFEELELEPDHVYQFAVAASSGGRASGMVWTTCIIPVSKGLERISQMTLEKDGAHSLLMRWQLDCGAQKPLVDSYQIELCRVPTEYRKIALHDNTGCAVSLYKPNECLTYNVSNPDAEEYVLDGLDPHTAYRGVIRIFSNGKLTIDSPAQCAATDSRGSDVSMIIGIAVGGAIGLTALVFVLYLLAGWMKKKSDMIKEMKVQLPDALHSSEENQMHSYKNMENGVARKASDPNASPRSIYGRSFGAGDGLNKKRHGSGHSQGSSSSTDELLYKKGRRADALGRNPSGDSGASNGHDSLTSVGTVRTQASSCDSGAESDAAAAPPSPDSVFGSHTPLARVRTLLPKLDENDDRESQDSGLDAGPSQQPHDKVGINPEPQSQLASQLLANSEPSLCEIDGTEAAAVTPVPEVASYSKFGLAKSAGNISELEGNPIPFSVCQSQPPAQDSPPAMPYSRLGLRHQRPSSGRPFGDADVTVGMVLEQPRVLPHIKDVAAPLVTKPPTGYVAVGQAMAAPVPESGQGYSKFSIQSAPAIPKPTNGYVPLQSVMACTSRPVAAPTAQVGKLEPSQSSRSDSDLFPESASTSDDAAIAGGENSNASLEDFSFSSLSAPSSEESPSEQPATDSSPPLAASSSGYVSAASLPTLDPPLRSPQTTLPTVNGYVPALSVPSDSRPVTNGVSGGYVSHNAAFEWGRSPPATDQCKSRTADAAEIGRVSADGHAATNGYVALSTVTDSSASRTPGLSVRVDTGSPSSSQHVDCSV